MNTSHSPEDASESGVQGMRFAQPACGQLVDVNHAEKFACAGKLVKNVSGFIARTVIDCNDLVPGVIQGKKAGQRRRQFFSFVPGSENHRNKGRVPLGAWRRV